MIDLGGSEWLRALDEGLRARVVEVDCRGQHGNRLVIFSKKVVRVGYADFVAGTTSLGMDYEDSMLAAAKRHRVDVIRYQGPIAALASPRHARYALSTSLIPALQGWDERALEKSRRTSNRMARTELQLRRGDASDADAVYRLYMETMRRNGGVGRYTRAYFAVIAAASTWVACLNGAVIGFVATGRSGNRGLYLHGGHCESARQHYPSDLLFLTMLREAKREGLESFDFLASPPRQRSLLDYKRAWGAEVHPLVVSDHPLGWRGRAFSLAYAAVARFLRR